MMMRNPRVVLRPRRLLPDLFPFFARLPSSAACGAAAAAGTTAPGAPTGASVSAAGVCCEFPISSSSTLSCWASDALGATATSCPSSSSSACLAGVRRGDIVRCPASPRGIAVGDARCVGAEYPATAAAGFAATGPAVPAFWPPPPPSFLLVLPCFPPVGGPGWTSTQPRCNNRRSVAASRCRLCHWLVGVMGCWVSTGW